MDLVGLLFTSLGGRVIDGRGTLGTSPSSLSDEESRADSPRVNFTRVLVDDGLLGLDHGAGLALVVDPQNLGAEFEVSPFGARGQGFEELDQPLAIDDPPGVEFRDSRDGVGLLGGVEIYHFLGRLFECYSLASLALFCHVSSCVLLPSDTEG